MLQPVYMLAMHLLLAGSWTSVWAEDFEAEAEEVMLESDATSEAAKQAKDRVAREKKELDKAKRDAEGMKMRAEIRKRHSGEELAVAEKEGRALRTEIDKQVKIKAAAEKDIAFMEAKLKAGQDKLNKTKGELEAIKQIREEQKKKIADLNKLMIETKAANNNLIAEVTAAKVEYEKGRLEDKKAQADLEKAKIEEAKRKQQLEIQIQQWKAQYKAGKDKTAATEAELRELRKGVAKKEEEAKYAEAEVKANEARMKDAEARLHQMKQEASSKEADMLRRKANLEQKIQSREAQDAKNRMDEAAYTQTLQRAAASSDKTPVQVEMKKATRYTLTKECSVYDKPDTSAKVLGKKKPGSSFPGEVSGEFISFRLKDQRVVFVPKNCF